MVKKKICLPVEETHKRQVRSLGKENPLEKEMTTHSSILAWEIPWTEEPGGPESMGSQKIQTRLSDEHTKTSSFSFLHTHTHTHTHTHLFSTPSWLYSVLLSALLDTTPNVFFWSVNKFFINCWNLGVVWCGLCCRAFRRSYVLTEARCSILN